MRGAMELRSGGVEDVDAVMALWAVAAENAGRPADRREMVEALVARDPEALLLALDDEAGGAVVGSLIAGWDGWRFHLYRLAVHPSWRRRGVGRALLDAAEARFVALGATRVDAMVLDANDLGASIWRAAGYERQDDWRRWVKALR
jgi:ribosomal protein S18 acetylase RimI-like enzyme